MLLCLPVSNNLITCPYCLEVGTFYAYLINLLSKTATHRWIVASELPSLIGILQLINEGRKVRKKEKVLATSCPVLLLNLPLLISRACFRTHQLQGRGNQGSGQASEGSERQHILPD